MNGDSAPVGTIKSGSATTVEQNAGWAGFCLNAKAISWAQGDTAETIAQIKEHNGLGKKHCGWKGALPSILLRGAETGK